MTINTIISRRLRLAVDLFRIARSLTVIAFGVLGSPLLWLAFRWQHRNRKRKA